MKKKIFYKIIFISIFSFIMSFGNIKGTKVEAAPNTPALGQICLMAMNFVPRGWAKCDGTLLAISNNNALFTLLGTTYGGDGSATFALPSLKSPIPNAQYCIATQGIFPSVDSGTGFDPILGQVELFPYNFTPSGWAKCEGQYLNIKSNQALFAILGTKFGGNGTSNFRLPDLRGTEPNSNMHYCIAISGLYPSDGEYSNNESLIGSINLYAPSNQCKADMGLCDGGVLNIDSNTAAVFATTGAYYGGNGTTTFGKPDLRGAVPNPQLSYYLQLQGIYPAPQ